jgi:DNA gyrase/topoisomerase IV subunit B
MWIRTLIITTFKERETIEKDVVHMSMPPTFKAKYYHVM